MQFRKILGALLASAGLVAAVHARDFSAADIHPLDHPTVATVKKIGETLNQKTNGKYNIKLFANSALGSEAEAIEQVKAGALDMARVSTLAFQGSVPEAALLNLPFLFRDPGHFRRALSGPAGERILTAFERQGLVGLVLLDGQVHSICAQKAVRNPGDIRGFRLPALTATHPAEVEQTLGTITVPLVGDIAAAFKTKQIDAVECSPETYASTRLYEAAPVFSETLHSMTPDILIFSKKVWDTLTQEERRIVRETARETLVFHADQLARRRGIAKEAAKQAGALFIEDINRPEFAAAFKPVWEKAASTPDLKALMQTISNTK